MSAALCYIFCISIIFSGQYENINFSQNLIFTFTLKTFSPFSLYFWHKLFGSLNKEIFLHVLLNFLFAIISKLSENVYQQKWNNFFLFTINTFESI